MRFLVLANDDSWNELSHDNHAIEWQRIDSLDEFPADSMPDALFVLDGTTSFNSITSVPVFINSVASTLKELKAGTNVIRFNGWPGFIQKETWEISGTVSTAAEAIFSALGKKYLVTADEPGFISARILAMIINEAYFAEGENVSTVAEIDTAMKLGTNYPFGPFEWADKIGLDKVAALLNKLSLTDERYALAPALMKNLQA